MNAWVRGRPRRPRPTAPIIDWTPHLVTDRWPLISSVGGGSGGVLQLPSLQGSCGGSSPLLLCIMRRRQRRTATPKGYATSFWYAVVLEPGVAKQACLSIHPRGTQAVPHATDPGLDEPSSCKRKPHAGLASRNCSRPGEGCGRLPTRRRKE